MKRLNLSKSQTESMPTNMLHRNASKAADLTEGSALFESVGLIECQAMKAFLPNQQ